MNSRCEVVQTISLGEIGVACETIPVPRVTGIDQFTVHYMRLISAPAHVYILIKRGETVRDGKAVDITTAR